MIAKVAPIFLLAAAVVSAQPYRPAFHFTPEKNWMNDPNGLVFYEGEYHLHYQYNPFGEHWGHMTWGHAVSSDLVHWQHLPYALTEGDGVMIFSGNAVIDWNNTSGFGQNGQPPMVAIYTGFRESDQRQYQCLAYSNDRARSWVKYSGNPVMDLGMTEFRDPRAQWYEPAHCWVITTALSAEHKVRIYHSPDLKHWTEVSDFGPAGSTAGVWECPDFFELPVDGDAHHKKWVLMVSISGGAPAGQSGIQYFVGDFDGSHFVADADSVFAPTAPVVPAGRMLADFEGADYGAWQATGTAFGSGPAPGAFPGQNPVAGYRGHGLVNTFLNGDGSTGTLTSPAFTVTNDYINFLIGAGSHAGVTCMNLLVDGQIVRTATGHDNELLTWDSWDVHALRNRTARIQIVDEDTGGWGHINVDDIMLADAPARPSAQPALWVDQGADFYAATSYSEMPKGDHRRVFIGWLNHWPDGLPGVTWRGSMSIPRVLTLRQTPAGVRLFQAPIAELKSLRLPARPLSAANHAPLEFALDVQPGQNFKFNGKTFAAPASARHLQVFIDTSSVEVFVNDGESVYTDLTFPPAAAPAVECPDSSGVQKMEVWPLQSIWK
ncbi:MAG TPA: glycoside hydrolase family 32 protein [Verrucomicrobiae bacterium]|jgi:sucrose-6-phosphate hydrolase SacC (GH32 family)|nr:glycoside hydrolase family 32 protein [Verrucomicrobiae bacterium]